MAKSDKYMADHVRSAKVWLEKAERSFNSQSDIQGELNLMLAEAEMKNLRKKRAAKIPLKQMAIACIAAMAAIAGIGWFWYERHDEPVVERPARHIEERHVTPPAPVAPPPAVPADDAAPIEMTPADMEGPAYIPAQPDSWTAPAEPVPSPETVHTVTPDTAPAPAASEPAMAPVDTPAEHTPVLTDRQIQDAVQDARHTLRSTAKERT